MIFGIQKSSAIAEGKAVAAQKEEYEWGKGTVQKEQDALYAEELKNIASEPFARSRDKVDAVFREQIHADDPMAEYMFKKRDAEKRKNAIKSGKPIKPVYKGPTPRPNRFGIPPGYRWDGRDRGTGWEDRVLGEAAAKKRTKDASYEWSVADM